MTESGSWFEVRVTKARNSDAVSRALIDLGSQGVQEVGDALLAYFPPTKPRDEIASTIARADTGAVFSITFANAPDSLQWHGRFEPQTIGSLTVTPPWLARESDPEQTIVIEPAMAFGTGDHPTTRGVVRLMQTLNLKNKTVADLGAGSAILSIAAAKLGARRAVAIEIDPDAAGNAAENIDANAVDDRVHFLSGDARTLLPLVAPVDVILANILSSVVIELLPVMHESLSSDGHAILSGILIDECDAVRQSFSRAGFVEVATDIEAEWWSVLISRA